MLDQWENSVIPIFLRAVCCVLANLHRQSLQTPPPEFLPLFEQLWPYVFVADEAFPLSKN